MANIKSVFDGACGSIKMEPAFLKKVHAYGTAFVNRNEDHVKFFGGNLTGVHPVRFRSSDELEFLDELLNVDKSEVRQQIIALPTINEEWKRGTDVMNLSCLYLVHRIYNSGLSKDQKEKGMIDVLLVLQYKLISSLMAHYYKYPADVGLAKATYATLSLKFAIKKHGSWHGVLLARAKDIIASNSVHATTIARFDDDGAIQYMITDIQGRLRSMVRKLWEVFENVRNQDARILTISGTIELDGKIVVRDVTRNYTPVKRYIHEVVLDKPRFIKPELINIIEDAMHTMPGEALSAALNYMSENASKNRDITELLDETLLHAFEYLSGDRRAQELMNDPGGLVGKMRGLYMASRSQDPVLLKMRKLGEKIVKKAIVSKSESTIAAVRTGLLLYIVLRSFTRSYYG